jgi:hypothetical protein
MYIITDVKKKFYKEKEINKITKYMFYRNVININFTSLD